MEEILNQILSEVQNMESDMSIMKSQFDENTRILKVLEHRTDELDAKFDGLLFSTATKESIARLETKMATKDDIDR